MKADDSDVEIAKLRPKEENAWETPTAQGEEEERPVTQEVSDREAELGQHCAGSQTIWRARVLPFPILCRTKLL